MHKILLGLAGAAVSAALAAFPVYAQSSTSQDTTTLFSLTGGSLSITAPPTANLGAGTTSSTTLSGQLGNVVVTDNRGQNTIWTAKVHSTPFTDTSNNSHVIPASAVSYSPGALVTSTGVAGDVFTPGAGGALSATDQTAYSATVDGDNSATWNPTLTLTVPMGAAAAQYSGTVTHSVA
jgi:hypothetical protein